jgi:hypothetical protein
MLQRAYEHMYVTTGLMAALFRSCLGKLEEHLRFVERGYNMWDVICSTVGWVCRARCASFSLGVFRAMRTSVIQNYMAPPNLMMLSLFRHTARDCCAIIPTVTRDNLSSKFSDRWHFPPNCESSALRRVTSTWKYPSITPGRTVEHMYSPMEMAA